MSSRKNLKTYIPFTIVLKNHAQAFPVVLHKTPCFFAPPLTVFLHNSHRMSDRAVATPSDRFLSILPDARPPHLRLTTGPIRVILGLTGVGRIVTPCFSDGATHPFPTEFRCGGEIFGGQCWGLFIEDVYALLMLKESTNQRQVVYFYISCHFININVATRERCCYKKCAN